jgi:hypothetical protein
VYSSWYTSHNVIRNCESVFRGLEGSRSPGLLSSDKRFISTVKLDCIPRAAYVILYGVLFYCDSFNVSLS